MDAECHLPIRRAKVSKLSKPFCACNWIVPNQTPESDEEMREDEDGDSDGGYFSILLSFSLIHRPDVGYADYDSDPDGMPSTATVTNADPYAGEPIIL